MRTGGEREKIGEWRVGWRERERGRGRKGRGQQEGENRVRSKQIHSPFTMTKIQLSTPNADRGPVKWSIIEHMQIN